MTERPMPLDLIKRTRDERLRRAILDVLHLASASSPTGEMSGRALVDTIDALFRGDDGIEDDEHAMRLLKDLALFGFIDMRDARRYKGQRWGLDAAAFRISAAGVELIEEMRPPHPAVRDDRRGVS